MNIGRERQRTTACWPGLKFAKIKINRAAGRQCRCVRLHLVDHRGHHRHRPNGGERAGHNV